MAIKLNDVTLAYRTATGAGTLLKGVRAGGLLRSTELGSTGDDLSQQWISRVLRTHRPDDGMLSEEAPDNVDLRIDRDRVWIIDPLDGTREYSSGRRDWSIHIALVTDGIPTVAAVAMPDAGHVFHTENVSPVDGPLSRVIVVSRNRPPIFAEELAEKMDFHLHYMGSAGAKAMSVVLGDSDAYVHAGGQYEWDSAAPVGVAMAAGLHCSRLDGSALRYNQADTYLPDLLICRKEIADELLGTIAQINSENNN